MIHAAQQQQFSELTVRVVNRVPADSASHRMSGLPQRPTLGLGNSRPITQASLEWILVRAMMVPMLGGLVEMVMQSVIR